MLYALLRPDVYKRQDEWHSWAQHYAVNLTTSSGIGFDRSDLAVIAAMNHIGVAMGRKRPVSYTHLDVYKRQN